MKGVIFDFNGVLWWDGELQEEAWAEFARELRHKPFSSEEMAFHMHGRTNREVLQYLTGRPIVGGELEELKERKESIYRQMCLEQGEAFRLSPGAAELLDYLVEHRIPRTIATASERVNLDFFICHLNLASWFDPALVVYDDGTRPGKPAPDVYLEAARRIGLPPRECIVVEDSRSGIAAAHAAGIGAVVALGPRETHAALLALPGVTTAVASLKELRIALLQD